MAESGVSFSEPISEAVVAEATGAITDADDGVPNEAAAALGADGAAAAEAAGDAPPESEGADSAAPEGGREVGEADAGEAEAEVGQAPSVAAGAPETLEALLAAHPALAAAVEGSPELKAPIEALVAGQKDLAAYQQVFATAEEAKHAASSAQFLAGVDRLYYSSDPAAPEQFLRQLYDSQFLRDPDSGELLRDGSGAAVSSGAYNRITGAYRDLLFDNLNQRARDLGDEALGNAVARVRQHIAGETAGGLPTPPNRGMADASTHPPAASLPAEVQQRLQRLEVLERQAREAQDAAARNEAAARQGQSRQDLAAMADAVSSAVRADIEQALATAALPQYLRSKIADEIFSALNQQAGADPAFQARMDALLRIATAPGSADAARARIVAAVRAHAKPRMGAIAQRILSEAGAGLREQQQAVAAKIAAQRRRTEVKSGGGAPPPARRSTPSQVQQLEQTLGRRLSDREILDL